MKYENLKELAEGFKRGELDGYKLVVDSDTSFLDWHGDSKLLEEKREESRQLYRGYGYYNFIEALDALGIPNELP